MKTIERVSVINFIILAITILLWVFGDRLPIFQPDLPPFGAIVKQPGTCHNGPNIDYLIASAAYPDTQVIVLAQVDVLIDGGSEKWFLVQGEGIGRCWMISTDLNWAFKTSELSSLVTALTEQDTPCYRGPNTVSDEQTIIPAGWRIIISGKNSLTADWLLVTPHDSTTECWVEGSLFSGIDLGKISIVDTQIPPTATVTPTSTLPAAFKAVVFRPSFCHTGPSESYLGAITLSSGVEVDLLASNSDGGDWYLIKGINFDSCWINAEVLDIPSSILLDKILVFTTVITLENTPCHIYPSVERAVQTVIPKDRRIVVYGKSDTDATWVLVLPHDSTNLCWAQRKTLSTFSYSSLPIESANLALTLQPTATRRSSNGSDGNNNQISSPIPTAANSVPPTNTPIPPTPIPPTSVPPTPTLCWPPGHCK